MTTATQIQLDVAAVRAILDRLEDRLAMLADDSTGDTITAQPTDPRAPRVRWRTFTITYNNVRIELGNTLLLRAFEYLLLNADAYVSASDLADAVWRGEFASDQTIRSTISRLRTALRTGGMADLAAAIDGTQRGHYAISSVWKNDSNMSPM